MPALPALTILLATAGLAACAFTLLYLHAASLSRDAVDAVALAELTAFYSVDEADTQPLPHIDRAEMAVEASESA